MRHIGPLALLLALLLGACATASPPSSSPPQAPAPDTAPDTMAETWQSPLSQEHPLVGRVWHVAEARFATPAEVTGAAAKARFVLLGESHDNPDHHRLQAEIIDAVAAAAVGRSPAVVFEMIDHERQDAVDEQLRSAPGDADALAEAIEWDASGWPPWPLYRPVFAATLARSLRVIAANLPRAAAMELARGQRELPPELVATYGLDAPLPDDLHQALLDELFESHCGLMPREALASLMIVQRARDALMADGLARHADPDGAILVAGSGHVRTDRAVPWYLGRAGVASAEEILAIGFREVADELTEPTAYGDDGALPFDYVWFTPRANDIDHCKELEERMRKPRDDHDGADSADDSPAD
ncbi:ChaN family lipoprotein [Haliangium sp.]|uniref:ChaN family lipoprotein n=1 Tax=Haliangium sp. TaxID=2663208 RepID=UPI003D0D1C31